jgi:hypothetical protein
LHTVASFFTDSLMLSAKASTSALKLMPLLCGRRSLMVRSQGRRAPEESKQKCTILAILVRVSGHIQWARKFCARSRSPTLRVPVQSVDSDRGLSLVRQCCPQNNLVKRITRRALGALRCLAGRSKALARAACACVLGLHASHSTTHSRFATIAHRWPKK